ncbi:ACP phosphodiesterase [Psychroflexus salinarum]|uniref:ACP phosphodiesterase n=1 Tax=Psychroflexus salinarum TaxID=546024 RepID=A0ABW3GKA5_9FLAO
MNYLAHIYLSGNDDFLKLGNFMADEIKGKSYLKYPEEIQKGILLHRAIDDFTDHHPLVSKGAHRFFDKLRHYNGVVIDMIYDHILAKHWGEYSDVKLPIFAEEFYLLLKTNEHLLPEKISKVVPYMIEHNWLLSYANIEDLTKILKQMNNKTKHETQLHKGVEIYLTHQDEFETEFKSFFEDIRAFCKSKINEQK